MISMVDPGTNRDGEKADSPVGVNVGGELLDQIQASCVVRPAVLALAIQQELKGCRFVEEASVVWEPPQVVQVVVRNAMDASGVAIPPGPEKTYPVCVMSKRCTVASKAIILEEFSFHSTNAAPGNCHFASSPVSSSARKTPATPGRGRPGYRRS